MFQHHSSFTNNICTNTNASNACVNPCKAFSEKEEEGSNIEIEEESKTEEISSKQMKNKDNENDIENACERFEENCNTELIVNDALMVLIELLNEDHVKTQHESNKVINRYSLT